MKNKKSKIIVPALGLILLSTTASISGSVAWFTANRTAEVKATSFAVVKTGDNLDVQLGAGVGTAVSNTENNKAVTVTSGYSLTDGSFNHALYSGEKILPVVTPNIPRDQIQKVTPLAQVNDGEMVRDNVAHVYTAFTWTMTFTITFSQTASFNQGLFLDLSNNASYMHEKFRPAQGDSVTSFYTDEACTANASGTASGTTDYYKETPDATGQAFRIAFVPTAIGGTGTEASTFYSKVWAANEGTASGSSRYVSVLTGSLTDNASYASYGTATSALSGIASGYSYSAATAGTDKVLIKNNDKPGIPNDGSTAKSTALSSNSNYLGYFTKNPGKTVSVTFTCVAWYEGSHPTITGEAADFETIVAGMKFGVTNLTD